MQNSDLTITTPGERDVVITRSFNANPQFVFKALTTPELVKCWSAPDGWTFETCEIDLRVGGKWRFQMCQAGGKVIGQFGEYKEIVPGERLVNTENWEDWDAGETTVTIELRGEGDMTKFTNSILFPSQEVRDIVLRSGLEKSVGPLYDNLADVVASLAIT